MKPWLKILTICGITLASLIVIVLLTVGTAVWIVFTPDRVTPIARDFADEYVTAPHELGEVELTFFSTFPYFGVRVAGLQIVNPVPGAQSDTLLAAKEVEATIDIMAFLSLKKLDIGRLTLRDVQANIYIDSLGVGNWNVFNLPPDTTAEDTSAFSLPFDELRVDNAMMASNRLSFVDRKDSIDASIRGFAFDATVDGWDDVRLKLRTMAVNARVKETTYATDAELSLDLPAAVHLDSLYFALREASVQVNDLKLGINGWIALRDSIRMDLRVEAKRWDIETLLALVPKQFTAPLKDITARGLLTLEAAARGTYNDSTMPILDARLLLEDAEAQYKPLPYLAENIQADIQAHLDLNDSLASTADLTLEADTKKSHVRLAGSAKELLSDALIEATATVDANLPDFAYFLPKTMKLDGKTQGDVTLKARLSELTSMQLRGGKIQADLKMRKLQVKMDDLEARLPEATLAVRLPNNRPSQPAYRWMGADLKISDIDLKMGDMKAMLKQPVLRAETNNLLQSKAMDINASLQAAQLTAKSDSMDIKGAQPRLTAKMRYSTKQDALPAIDATLQMAGLNAQYTDIQAALKQTKLVASMRGDQKERSLMHLTADLETPDLNVAKGDSMQVHLTAPKLAATMHYNSQDTTTLPTIDATLDFANLDGAFADVTTTLKRSKLIAGMRSEKNRKAEPQFNANLQSAALRVMMGETVKAQTQTIAVDAKAHYNPKAKKNVLLQWNPHLRVNLQQGEAELAMLTMPIVIPAIDFSYTNKIFRINRSQVHLGSSDFTLSGDINDIGPWLRGEGILKGDLNFESDYTDVNELMAMFSAEEGSEEQTEPKPKTEKTASQHEGPFLVPTDVDLALNTRIGTADVFTEQIYNVGGKLYVRNGVLALEEMGFVCNAARLQLTAMYRTPRRNHLYLGLDYHMLDVDIDTLIDMIPTVKEMVPMLSSFKGNAEFHLAAETYLNQNYQPKMSTLRGAASLFAKDLVVMDGETFTKIAKLLNFKKKTENKVDSISAELTVYKNEIDVYPFCVQMDNYMVAMGGRHNTNMTFDYDINVLSPIYLGVNVSGNLDNLNIKLAKCKFAKDFRPIFHRKVDTESADLRRRIRQSMQKNVKI